MRNQAEFIDVVLEDERTRTGVKNHSKHELKRKLGLSLSESGKSTSKRKTVNRTTIVRIRNDKSTG